VVFEVKDKDLGGRIGKLVTKSGTIETPAFFPVINPLKQFKEVPVSLLKDLGFTQLITNAYIIKKSVGGIQEIHKFLGFDGVVMTDSGAYQLLRYGRRSVHIDPVEIVKFQDAIGSDIAVIADIPTRDDATYEEALYSVEETLRRAKMVLDIVGRSKTLWVLPVQGGIHLRLLRKSALMSKELEGFSIYAIGSPVLLMEKYEYSKVIEMVLTVKKVLPIDKPVHLFGAGHPMIIPFIVALGVDMFDSASYILYARDGRYITERITYKLEDLDYLPCECPICSKYDVKSLLELSNEERIRNLALHNLYVILREIKKVKVAIREGRLWELLEERARSHPSLRYLLTLFRRKDISKLIELLDPRVRGDAHALFLYETTSLSRPELIRHEDYLNRYIDMRGGSGRTALLIPRITEENYEDFVKDSLAKFNVTIDDAYFYIPFFTLIPMVLSDTYPYSQFKIPEDVDKDVLLIFANRLRRYVRKLLTIYETVHIISCSRYRWCSEAFIKKSLKELISSNVNIINV